MATGSPLALYTHIASHWVSWGQTRPQTAGRALSRRSISAALGRSPSARALINSGMDTLTGQPAMHCLVLHCRQRRASRIASSRERPRFTSSKVRLRLSGSPSDIWTRLMASRSFGVSLLPMDFLFTDPAFFRGVAEEGLLVAIGGEAVGKAGEIDLMTVEFGAVHAGELHLAAYHDPAAAAHAGAVDHDRVEADDGFDAVRPGQLRDRAHHRHRTDGENRLGRVLRIGYQFGEDGGD